MIDGRPHIDGERPTMRDYTPLNYDAERNTLQMEFAEHGTGPAVEWARTAPIGQWLGLAGPRGSLVVPADLDWHVLLGDESAMPAIERRLAELPGETVLARLAASSPATLPKTTNSVSEFEPRRLAPWIPTLAHSPMAKRPGSDVSQLPSTLTPPIV